MSRVKTETCGCDGTKDVLDGKPLRKGQRVEIKFPNGHTEQAIITTTTITSSESCHNDKWTEQHVAAYVRVIVHGVGLKFRLAEHNLEVTRVKK